MKAVNPKKLLSVVVCLCYFTTQIAFGFMPESNFWANRHNQLGSKTLLSELPSVSSTLSNLASAVTATKIKSDKASASFQSLINSIPLSYGNIQDVYESIDKSQAATLIIQDIHLNSEAQMNIAGILQPLLPQMGLVGVEGAFASFDFGPFRVYPDKQILKDVATAYVRKDLLAAPAFVGITAMKTPPFLGIDDRTHYEANVRAYLASKRSMKAVTIAIQRLRLALSAEKQRVFSAELKKFDALNTAYHEQEIGLGAYLKRLSDIGDTSQIKNMDIERFLAAYELESSLDFNRVAQERTFVIEKLAKKLNEKDLASLFEMSVAYRAGRLEFGAYYRDLKHYLDREGVSLDRTPAFGNYLRYIFLSDGIKAADLFASIEKIERSLIERLATSPQEKRLAAQSAQLALTEKLVDFSMTPSEWKKYSQSQPLVPALDSFEAFYREADLRSRTMVRRLLEAKTPGNRVLVVGGFHTPELTRLLREKKASYIVVSPKVTKVDDKTGSAYLSVFARDRTPLDRLFAGEKLFISPSGVAGVGTPSGVETKMKLCGDVAARTVDRNETVPPQAPVQASHETGPHYRLSEPNGVLVDVSKKPGEGFSISRRALIGIFLSSALLLILPNVFPEIPRNMLAAIAVIAFVSPYFLFQSLIGFDRKDGLATKPLMYAIPAAMYGGGTVLAMASRNNDIEQTLSSKEGEEAKNELAQSGVDQGFLPELARDLAGLHVDLKSKFTKVNLTLRDLMQLCRFIRINAERLGIGGAAVKGLRFIYEGRLSETDRVAFERMIGNPTLAEKLARFGDSALNKKKDLGIEHAQDALSYFEWLIQGFTGANRTYFDEALKKARSTDRKIEAQGLFSLGPLINNDFQATKFIGQKLLEIIIDMSDLNLSMDAHPMIEDLGFEPYFNEGPDIPEDKPLVIKPALYSEWLKKIDMQQLKSEIEKRTNGTPAVRIDHQAIQTAADGKSIRINDAVLSVRPPQPNDNAEDIPKLDALDPVYTNNLIDNIEAVALAAEGRFSLLFEGVTALGKSFAIKVAAAWRKQPLAAVGMHGALTSYEIIGGYHPSGEAANIDPKVALNFILEQKDASVLEEALEEVGLKKVPEQVNESPAQILALYEYLQSRRQNRRPLLTWEDGFLVSAMKQGKWLVLEELNLAPTDVLEVLNLYMVHGKLLVTRMGERIEYSVEKGNIHPDFRLFATMNPISTGGGRVDISEALLDRFIQRKITLTKAETQSELAAVAKQKLGLDDAWAQSLAQAQMALAEKAALWRKPLESREPYNFNLRHLLRLGMRLDKTKWEPLTDPAQRNNEIARQLSGVFFEIYGDAFRYEERKEELFQILDQFFNLSAHGITRGDVENFYQAYSVVPAAKKNAALVPGAEFEIAPTKPVRRVQVKISRTLDMAAKSGKFQHVLLAGPPASSKTSTVYDLFRQRGEPLHYVNLHGSIDFQSLVGGYVPTEKKGRYKSQYGPLVQAMLNGEAIFLDEMNLSQMPEWFNTVLDEGLLYLPGHQEPIRAVKGFTVLAAINPATQEGRQIMSAPLRSRFHEIWVEEISAPEDLREIVNFRLQKGRIKDNPTLAANMVAAHIEISKKYPKENFALRTLLGWADFIVTNRDIVGTEDALLIGKKLYYGGSLSAANRAQVTSLKKELPFDFTRTPPPEFISMLAKELPAHLRPTAELGADLLKADSPAAMANAVSVLTPILSSQPSLIEYLALFVFQKMETANDVEKEDAVKGFIQVVGALNENAKIETLERLHETANSIVDGMKKTAALMAVAQAYYGLKEEKRASELMKEASDAAESISNKRYRFESQVTVARTYFLLNDSERAEQALERAAGTALTFTNKQENFLRIAEEYRALKNSRKALETLEKSLEIVDEFSGVISRFKVLANIAIAYASLNETSTAEKLRQEAVTSVAAIDEPYLKSEVKIFNARVYFALHNEREAIALLNEAIDLSEQMDPSSELSQKLELLLPEIASAAGMLNDTTAAAALLDRIIKAVNGASDYSAAEITLSAVIRAVTSLKDPAESGPLLANVRALAESSTNMDVKYETLAACAEVYGKQNKTAEAVKLINQIITDATGHPGASGPLGLVQIRYIINTAGSLNDGDQALTLFRKTLDAAASLPEPERKQKAFAAVAKALNDFRKKIPLQKTEDAERILEELTTKLNKPRTGTATQGSAADQISVDSQKKSVRIGQAVLNMREPITNPALAADVPNLAKLSPIFTPGMVEAAESIAFAARGNFMLVFEGLSALGKSFAVKAVAALTGQPLVAIGMHQALTAYEAIGGFRPRVTTREPAVAANRLEEILNAAAASNKWRRLQNALDYVIPSTSYRGPPEIDPILRKAIASPLQSSELLNAMLDFLDGKESNLVWQDGFLIQAMTKGQWLVLEELNMAPSEVSELLNLFLVQKRIVFWRAGEQVELSYANGRIDPNFRLFGTMNPEAMGGGRFKLSDAFLSRIVRWKVDLSPEEQMNEWSEILMAKFEFEQSLVDRILLVQNALLDKRKTWTKGASARERYEFNLRALERLAQRLTRWERVEGKPFTQIEPKRRMLLLAAEMQEVFGDMLREETQRKDFWENIVYEQLGLKELGSTADEVKKEVDAVYAPKKGEQRTASFDELNGLYSEKDLDAVGIAKGQNVPVFRMGDVDLLRTDRENAVKSGLLVPDESAALAPVESTLRTQGKIARSMSLFENILLTGLTGVGKTSEVLDLFRQMKRSLFYYNMHGSASIDELIGGYVQSGRAGEYEFVPGILTLAMQAGIPILIDELNLSQLPEWFNTVLDDGVLWLPNGTRVKAAKGFSVIGAMNPPTADYAGRVPFSPALRSRFREIWVDPIEDKGELEQIVAFELNKAVSPAKAGAQTPPDLPAQLVAIHLKLRSEFPKAKFALRKLLSVTNMVKKLSTEMGLERSAARAFDLFYKAKLSGLDKEKFENLTKTEPAFIPFWSAPPREIPKTSSTEEKGAASVSNEVEPEPTPKSMEDFLALLIKKSPAEHRTEIETLKKAFDGSDSHYKAPVFISLLKLFEKDPVMTQLIIDIAFRDERHEVRVFMVQKIAAHAQHYAPGFAHKVLMDALKHVNVSIHSDYNAIETIIEQAPKIRNPTLAKSVLDEVENRESEGKKFLFNGPADLLEKLLSAYFEIGESEHIKTVLPLMEKEILSARYDARDKLLVVAQFYFRTGDLENGKRTLLRTIRKYVSSDEYAFKALKYCPDPDFVIDCTAKEIAKYFWDGSNIDKRLLDVFPMLTALSPPAGSWRAVWLYLKIIWYLKFSVFSAFSIARALLWDPQRAIYMALSIAKRNDPGTYLQELSEDLRTNVIPYLTNTTFRRSLLDDLYMEERIRVPHQDANVASIARLYMAEKNPEKAFEAIGNIRKDSNKASTLVYLLQKYGQTDIRAQLEERIFSIEKKINSNFDREEKGKTRNAIADAYLTLGNETKAIALIEESVRNWREEESDIGNDGRYTNNLAQIILKFSDKSVRARLFSNLMDAVVLKNRPYTIEKLSRLLFPSETTSSAEWDQAVQQLSAALNKSGDSTRAQGSGAGLVVATEAEGKITPDQMDTIRSYFAKGDLLGLLGYLSAYVDPLTKGVFDLWTEASAGGSKLNQRALASLISILNPFPAIKNLLISHIDALDAWGNNEAENRSAIALLLHQSGYTQEARDYIDKILTATPSIVDELLVGADAAIKIGEPAMTLGALQKIQAPNNDGIQSPLYLNPFLATLSKFDRFATVAALFDFSWDSALSFRNPDERLQTLNEAIRNAALIDEDGRRFALARMKELDQMMETRDEPSLASVDIQYPSLYAPATQAKAALTWNDLGQPEDAKRALKRAQGFAVEQNDIQGLKETANSFIKLGLLEDAVQVLNALSISANKADPAVRLEVFSYMAQTYARLGDTEKAAKNIEAAESLLTQPSTMKRHYPLFQLGLAYALLLNQTKSLNYFEQSIEELKKETNTEIYSDYLDLLDSAMTNINDENLGLSIFELLTSAFGVTEHSYFSIKGALTRTAKFFSRFKDRQRILNILKSLVPFAGIRFFGSNNYDDFIGFSRALLPPVLSAPILAGFEAELQRHQTETRADGSGAGLLVSVQGTAIEKKVQQAISDKGIPTTPEALIEIIRDSFPAPVSELAGYLEKITTEDDSNKNALIAVGLTPLFAKNPSLSRLMIDAALAAFQAENREEIKAFYIFEFAELFANNGDLETASALLSDAFTIDEFRRNISHLAPRISALILKISAAKNFPEVVRNAEPVLAWAIGGEEGPALLGAFSQATIAHPDSAQIIPLLSDLERIAEGANNDLSKALALAFMAKAYRLIGDENHAKQLEQQTLTVNSRRYPQLTTIQTFITLADSHRKNDAKSMQTMLDAARRSANNISSNLKGAALAMIASFEAEIGNPNAIGDIDRAIALHRPDTIIDVTLISKAIFALDDKNVVMAKVDEIMEQQANEKNKEKAARSVVRLCIEFSKKYKSARFFPKAVEMMQKANVANEYLLMDMTTALIALPSDSFTEQAIDAIERTKQNTGLTKSVSATLSMVIAVLRLRQGRKDLAFKSPDEALNTIGQGEAALFRKNTARLFSAVLREQMDQNEPVQLASQALIAALNRPANQVKKQGSGAAQVVTVQENKKAHERRMEEAFEKTPPSSDANWDEWMDFLKEGLDPALKPFLDLFKQMAQHANGVLKTYAYMGLSPLFKDIPVLAEKLLLSINDGVDTTDDHFRTSAAIRRAGIYAALGVKPEGNALAFQNEAENWTYQNMYYSQYHLEMARGFFAGGDQNNATEHLQKVVQMPVIIPLNEASYRFLKVIEISVSFQPAEALALLARIRDLLARDASMYENGEKEQDRIFDDFVNSARILGPLFPTETDSMMDTIKKTLENVRSTRKTKLYLQLSYGYSSFDREKSKGLLDAAFPNISNFLLLEKPAVSATVAKIYASIGDSAQAQAYINKFNSEANEANARLSSFDSHRFESMDAAANAAEAAALIKNFSEAEAILNLALDQNKESLYFYSSSLKRLAASAALLENAQAACRVLAHAMKLIDQSSGVARAKPQGYIVIADAVAGILTEAVRSNTETADAMKLLDQLLARSKSSTLAEGSGAKNVTALAEQPEFKVLSDEAIALLLNNPEIISDVERLLDVLHDGLHPKLRSLFSSVEAIAHLPNDVSPGLNAYAYLGIVPFVRTNGLLLERILEAATKAAADISKPNDRFMVLLRIGEAYADLGEMGIEKGRIIVERSRAFMGGYGQAAMGLAALGLAFARLGDKENAAEYLEEASINIKRERRETTVKAAAIAAQAYMLFDVARGAEILESLIRENKPDVSDLFGNYEAQFFLGQALQTLAKVDIERARTIAKALEKIVQEHPNTFKWYHMSQPYTNQHRAIGLWMIAPVFFYVDPFYAEQISQEAATLYPDIRPASREYALVNLAGARAALLPIMSATYLKTSVTLLPNFPFAHEKIDALEDLLDTLNTYVSAYLQDEQTAESALRKWREEREKPMAQVAPTGGADENVTRNEAVGTLYIGETSLPILPKKKADNIPALENLRPVVTKGLAGMMELGALAVRLGKMMIFSGETALGKSFALKVLAAHTNHPYRAVGLHPALTTYELLGGYHPTGASMSEGEAAAMLKAALARARRENNWAPLLRALQETGAKMAPRAPTADEPAETPAEFTTRVENFLSNLTDADFQISLASMLAGKKATLEWKNGFLVDAAERGEWLVLEEINLAASEILEVLNFYLVFNRLRVLREGRWVDVKINPGFHLFGTMNPEDRYGGGRTRLSDALTDRLLFADVTPDEKQMERELVEIFQVKFGLQEGWARQVVMTHMAIAKSAKTWRGKFASKESYEFNLRHLMRFGERLEDRAFQYARAMQNLSRDQFEKLTPLERNKWIERFLQALRTEARISDYAQQQAALTKAQFKALSPEEKDKWAELWLQTAEITDAGFWYAQNATGMSRKKFDALPENEKRDWKRRWMEYPPGPYRDEALKKKLLDLPAADRAPHIDKAPLLALASDFWEIYGDPIRDADYRPALFDLMSLHLGLKKEGIEDENALEAAFPTSDPREEVLTFDQLLDFYRPEDLIKMGLTTKSHPHVLWVGGVPLLAGQNGLTPSAEAKPHVPAASTEVPVVETTRRYLGKIARSVFRSEHVLLVGGTGAGKTSMVFELFRRLGRPLYYINFHNGVNTEELVGGWHPTSVAGRYLYMKGLLAQAMKAGAPIYIDELNLSQMPEWFNTVMDDGILWMSNGEKVTAQPGFMVIGAINPPRFAGRHVLSPALRSRFREIWVEEISVPAEIAEIVLSALNGIGKKMFGFVDEWSKAIQHTAKVVFQGLRPALLITEGNRVIRWGLEALRRDNSGIQMNMLEAGERETLEKFLKEKANKTDPAEINALLAKANSLKIRAKTVSRMTGDNRSIELSPNPKDNSWFINMETKVIYYPPGDLLSFGADHIIFRAFHEGSHARYTRVPPSHELTKKFFGSEVYRVLLNAAEDIRIAIAGQAEFKGADHYIDTAYAVEFPKTGDPRDQDRFSKSLLDKAGFATGKKEGGKKNKVLPHMQYALGLIHWWRHQEKPQWMDDPDAQAAVEKTKKDFPDIFFKETLPLKQGAKTDLSAKNPEQQLQKPQDNVDALGLVSEADKLRFALQVMKLLDDRIVPEYDKLVEKSKKEVEEMIKNGELDPNGQAGNGQQSTLPSDKISEAAEKIVEGNAKDAADDIEGQGEIPQVGEAKRQARASKQGKTQQGTSPSKPQEPGRAASAADLIKKALDWQKHKRSSMTTLQKYLEPVVDTVDQLRGRLGNFLFPNSRPKDEGWFRSGKITNRSMQRLMEAEMTDYMNSDFKFFEKRTVPTKRDHRFSLVVDQSGSMSGELAKKAMEAVALFMETLEFLEVDYNVIGFSDGPSEYKWFADQQPADDQTAMGLHQGKLDEDQRNEVISNIQMGNATGSTNDRDAIKLSRVRLNEQQAERKVMIVITDGDGTNGPIAEEIRAARAAGIRVIAIPIGDAALQYVKKNYGEGNYVPVSNIEDLPDALGGVLEDEMRGSVEPETVDAATIPWLLKLVGLVVRKPYALAVTRVLETLLFGVLPAVSGSPVFSAALLALFAVLHLFNRDWMEQTYGVRPGLAQVLTVVLLHIEAIIGTQFLLSTMDGYGIAAVTGLWTAVAGLHEYISRRPGMSLAGTPREIPLADVRTALLGVVQTTELDLGLKTLSENERTGTDWGDVSEVVSKRLERNPQAIENFSAQLRFALTGEPITYKRMFAGSLNALWRQSAQLNNPEIVYQFLDDANYENTLTMAQKTLDGLRRDSTPVKIGFVTNDKKLAARLRNELKAPENVRVEFFSREQARDIERLERQSIERGFIDKADLKQATFRFIVPKSMEDFLPGFLNGQKLDQNRYRFYVMLTNTLNPLTVEFAPQQLNDKVKRTAQILKQA